MFLKTKQNNIFFSFCFYVFKKETIFPKKRKKIIFSVSSTSIATLSPLLPLVLKLSCSTSNRSNSVVPQLNSAIELLRDSVLKSPAPIQIDLTQTFLFINSPSHRSITISSSFSSLWVFGIIPGYYLFPFWILLCSRSICYLVQKHENLNIFDEFHSFIDDPFYHNC